MEQVQLEQFSHAALVVICKELAGQCHMLILSLMLAIESRYGREAALTIALFQMTGSCWVISERLCEAMDETGGGLDAIANVLAIHPALQPSEYIDIQLDRSDEQCLRISFAQSPAASELNGFGWYGLLAAGLTEGLDALVKGIDRHASITACGAMSWNITLANAAELIDEAAEEPVPVQIAKGTLLYQAKLTDHVQLLQSI